MAIVTVTKENFDTEVLQQSGRVLLDFWAVWCGPCRMISPFVDQLAGEMPELKVGKVNVDEQPELAERFEIYSIPTLLLFENGVLKDRSVGVIPKGHIRRFVEQ